jgi:hypothetical protein
MSCEYKGILFVLSSVGVERAGESNQINQDHYWHLENSFQRSMEDLRVAHDDGEDAGVV